VNRFSRGDGQDLTPREAEVLGLVVEGLSNHEIADRLCISARTAQAHIAAATRKTGTRTRTQLAVHALRSGLVPLHPDPDDVPEGDGRPS
jgi:DNA-binding CsgD family transcriptional regulator